MSESERKIGTVIRQHGLYSYIHDGEQIFQCTLRKKISRVVRDKKNLLVVGDRVEFLVTDDETGVIETIQDRRTHIGRSEVNLRKSIRKKAREHVLVANLDQLLIVSSAEFPPFNHGFIDRLIVGAVSNGVTPSIILNKMDLYVEGLEEELETYQELGYQVLPTSAEDGEGLEAIHKLLRGKMSVFLGQSGVGKTSLLREILPDLEARVHEVSEKTGKGMHTTTVAELHPLPYGGYIVDTPGLREFGVYNVDEQDLAAYFPEMAPLLGGCKFAPCSHLHEPGCVIREAVSDTITDWRYYSYCAMYQTLLDTKPTY